MQATHAKTRYTGPATVVRVRADRVRVRIDGALFDARWAVPGAPLPAPGDEVVLTGERPRRLYVIGLLGGGERRVTATPDEPLSVYDEQGELLFAYEGRKARVCVRGDLELVSQEGSVTLNAAQAVRLAGSRIEAIGLREATLRGAHLELAAQRADLKLDDTRYSGDALQADLERTSVAARTMETTARTIITRTRNAFRTVEKLSQTVAGRVRTLVSGALHLKAKDTFIKSDRDTRIDGEQIHLG
jgi:hypothetical protein